MMTWIVSEKVCFEKRNGLVWRCTREDPRPACGWRSPEWASRPCDNQQTLPAKCGWIVPSDDVSSFAADDFFYGIQGDAMAGMFRLKIFGFSKDFLPFNPSNFPSASFSFLFHKNKVRRLTPKASAVACNPCFSQKAKTLALRNAFLVIIYWYLKASL